MAFSIENNKLEQLVQMITPGSTLLRSWPLEGGISAEMTALELKRPDGQISTMILRRPSRQTFEHNPKAAQDEFRVLQLAKSLGLATQTPYYFDPSGKIFSTPYLVIEYVDGTPEFAFPAGDNFLFQMANHLARIHSVDISNRDLAFLPKQETECTEILYKSPTTIRPALDIKSLPDVLERASPLPQRNASVLIHGDYWPGNILWRDDALVAVIDWEDARIGDPLIDLAISRLDVLCIFGMDALFSFTHRYQALMDLDDANLPYWDLCASLRLARLVGMDLAGWIAFFIPFGRSDITEQSFREHFRFFIEQALGKLTQQ